MPPPTAPLRPPHAGVSAGRACAQRRLPPAARGAGRSERAGPAPPPGARGGRHGARGTGAIGAAPSLSLLPRGVRRAGQAGRGAARVRGGGPLPSPLAGLLACSLSRSLPPSKLRRVTALAPHAPAASAARPAFPGPGPAAQRLVDLRPQAGRRTSVCVSVRSEQAPRRTTAASPPRHYYALPSPRRASSRPFPASPAAFRASPAPRE